MIESPPKPVKVRACKMKIRVRKQDSAYLYQILESYEGLANYSTVTLGKELPYRDIELHIAPDLRAHVEALVDRLALEIPLERL
jgi:hypothetical protein